MVLKKVPVAQILPRSAHAAHNYLGEGKDEITFLTGLSHNFIIVCLFGGGQTNCQTYFEL